MSGRAVTLLEDLVQQANAGPGHPASG